MLWHTILIILSTLLFWAAVFAWAARPLDTRNQDQ